MYKLPGNIDDYSYKNIKSLVEKKVLIRSCLNVALDKDQKPIDYLRIKESAQILNELGGKCKSITVLAHLGRPEPGSMSDRFSLSNILEALNKELNDYKVELHDNIESIVQAQRLNHNHVIYLLENVRIFKGEESADVAEREQFAKELAVLGDLFINDSFPDYRKSASTFELPKILKSYLGPAYLKEVTSLSKLDSAKKPLVAVIGGAKLSEKLDLVNAIAERCDKLLIGGAMAYTFLRARGVEVGKSLIEESKIEIAKEILAKFGDKLILPIDHVIVKNFSPSSDIFETKDEKILDGNIGIDIGPRTVDFFVGELKKASTILWNGPLGIIEWNSAKEGTMQIVKAIKSNIDAYSIAGGGETISCLDGDTKGFSFISAGGGAMLEYIAKDNFPTLDAVLRN